MTVRVNGSLIKALRIKQSYSQEKLAEIVGVNLRTIQRIETNGLASLSTRGALASAFGVRPEDLDVSDSTAGAPEDLNVSDVMADPPSKRVGRRPRWPLLMLSIVLVVLGTAVLAVSINIVTPLGLLALSAFGGLLLALIGFVLLTLLTPLPQWRAYVILSIVGVSLVASPPAWTARALLALSLWATFELGILATRLRLPKHFTDA
jgi:transcriptional regulator with XRE-family HTH domain